MFLIEERAKILSFSNVLYFLNISYPTQRIHFAVILFMLLLQDNVHGNICRIIRSFSSPLIGIPAIYSVLTITLSHRLYKSGLYFLKLISLNQSLFLSAHERPVLIVHGF